jgi:hypothetical protein
MHTKQRTVLTCFVLIVKLMFFELLASLELICPSRLSIGPAADGLPTEQLA